MDKQCLTLQRLFFCFTRLSENIFNIKRLTLLVLWTYRHDILAGGILDVSMSYLRTRMITVRSLLKCIEFAKLLLIKRFI